MTLEDFMALIREEGFPFENRAYDSRVRIKCPTKEKEANIDC